MADDIYIGDFFKGMKTNPLPFNLDNDAFPTLYNMYVWRRRAKRKRGTLPLARLQRFLPLLLSPAAGRLAGLPAPNAASNTYTGNLITAYTAAGITYPLPDEPGSQIAFGSVQIWFDKGLGNETLYIDDGQGGFIKDHGPYGFVTGVINYITGDFTITFGPVGHPGAGVPVSASMAYYPSLPVMGLEDFISNQEEGNFPLLLAFDTKYSYQINQLGMPFFYNTNYYKGTNVQFVWSGQDYQQFWSTNYQSAFWATNNKSGLNLLNGVYVSGSGTNIITFTFTQPSFGPSPAAPFTTLVIGDKLWFNEWPSGDTVNGLVGTVSDITGAAAGTYQVTFDGAHTFVAGDTGIIQMLTNTLPGQDGIKWYDGDPTSGTGLPTGTGRGWVNFAPPLTASAVSINDQAAELYYLVGALAIVPFKDRLLFFGAQIQTSSANVIQIPLQDTSIWSWNGTPYYNSLVPTNANNSETFDVSAYYVDQTGKGGYLSAGISLPIVTVLNNEDVLLVGFGGQGRKTRFVYSGNDLQPFIFYLINSELPSNSTFSGVVLDRGALEIGAYGITITTQQSSSRIDLDITDSVFEIQAANHGQQRVNAIRDYFREWIYFSYPIGNGNASEGSWVFPTQTFMFNYRDNTWAILYENFTRHGNFRPSSGFTWQTCPYPSWDTWTEPWNTGSSEALFPSIIAGTPQGYVVIKGLGTSEAPTGAIYAISDGIIGTQITSYNHCVSVNDYLSFGGQSIGKVIETIDEDNFIVDIPYPSVANITGATKDSQAVLTLEWDPAADAPNINTYFVGQQVAIAGVVGMTQLNGNVYTIVAVTPTTITINVDSTGFSTYVSGGTTTLTAYIGSGTFSRLSQPLLQTKQFPFYWQQGRQVRVGVQRYLMDVTANGQVTIGIGLSQDPENFWNESAIVPADDVLNESLIYSETMFTCPETYQSSSTGINDANSSLQSLVSQPQRQMWHRVNTSLQGDTFQIGLTLNDTQMRNLEYATSEIALHAMHFKIYPGPSLS